MSSVTDLEPAGGSIELIELKHDSGTRAVVAPSRGALVTELEVAGKSLLFLDESSFLDTTRNVRGGVPVLFPSPGKLADDRWSRDGRAGVMKQHGFGRTSSWTEVGRQPEVPAVELRLGHSEATLAQFPWPFEVSYRFSLSADGLVIDMVFVNPGTETMPFGAGFHPYFRVPQYEKANAEIETRATKTFDNVAKKNLAFEGFDLTQPEVDMFLLDHGSTSSSLWWPGLDGHRVVVAGSEHMTHWVVWTLQGRDFVCLEPWSCPGDALNSGEGLQYLGPGDKTSMWVEIKLAAS